MDKTIVIFVSIGIILTVSVSKGSSQGIHMFQGRGPPPPPLPSGPGPDQDDQGDELQDESELASALGIDRQALYEDLMRIQHELGGAPMNPLMPLGGIPSEQSSQESDY